MAFFSQQLINGLTLGAIYGLIAIGYTMVYGIIGMINFAHGEIFMIGAFISIIGFQTVDKGGALGINTRFDWVAIAVGIVFFGRIGLVPRQASTVGQSPGAAASAGTAAPYLGPRPQTRDEGLCLFPVENPIPCRR